MLLAYKFTIPLKPFSWISLFGSYESRVCLDVVVFTLNGLLGLIPLLHILQFSGSWHLIGSTLKLGIRVLKPCVFHHPVDSIFCINL